MEGRPREMCLTHIYCITSRMVVRILPSKRSKYGSLTTQLNCPNWDSYSYHRCVRELVEAFGDIKRSRYFKQGFWQHFKVPDVEVQLADLHHSQSRCYFQGVQGHAPPKNFYYLDSLKCNFCRYLDQNWLNCMVF